MAKRCPPDARRPEPSDNEHDRIERLTAAVEQLAGQVRVLRDALDDLREEYAWALRNREPPPPVPPFVPLTSLPRDPLAADFAERVNRVKPEDLPPDDPPPASQGSLY